jgi:hypothetical protein
MLSLTYPLAYLLSTMSETPDALAPRVRVFLPIRRFSDLV